jgi:2,4-dienoyl-CoA reductase (NADPH2)
VKFKNNNMLSLKNQFIFAPVKTGYSDGSGIVTKKHLAFYERRAQYIGAITPEPFYLDKGLREIPTQMGIDNDDKNEGLKKLTDAIHKYDTKVIAHLSHPGRMANPKIPGNYFISSTDEPCENGGATPKRMDIDDTKKVINLFVEAALRAEKSGFDIIELQFGHGYLPAQFISPLVNNRNDEYGGVFENRIKFPFEILKAVKEVINLPVIVRISGDEMIPQGIKLPEMIEFSKILQNKGVHAIHVSAGSVCSTPPWYFQHMFIEKGKTWELAKAIKNQVNSTLTD